MKKLSLLIFILLLSVTSKSAVRTATASGNWNSAATWSTAVPGCGDVVVIPLGVTVTVSANADYSACTPTVTQNLQIYVYGRLQFTNGRRLFLPCGSGVYVTSTGSLVPDVGGGSSTYLEICDSKVWTAAAGTFTGAACLPTPCVVSNNPLPVELIAFTGFLETKAVFLEWKTITESNNSHFEVEKSIDGFNFYKFSSVPSKGENGNSKTLLTYKETDTDIKHPLYYYRLKQVDIDGTFKYSNKIAVRVYPTEFKIYPNPNAGTFKIDIPTKEPNQSVDLKIYDQYSQLISDNRYSVINDKITGSVIEVIPQNPLPKGIYICLINYKGELHRLKLTVN